MRDGGLGPSSIEPRTEAQLSPSSTARAAPRRALRIARPCEGRGPSAARRLWAHGGNCVVIGTDYGGRGRSGRGGRWIEFCYQAVEDGFELWVIVIRMSVYELDDPAVAIGCFFVLAPRLVHLTEAIVSVMYLWGGE